MVSFFVTIGSIYLLKSYIAARAQLVTFICFILLLYNIERFLENKKIRYAVCILLLHILIANLHVAVWPFTFVIYLPYIAEYLMCEVIEFFIYDKLRQKLIKDKITTLDKKIRKRGSNKELEEKKALQEKKLELIKQKNIRIKEQREEDLKNAYKIRMEKNTNARWLILILVIALLTGFLTPLGTVPYTYTYLTLQGNTMSNINEHLPLTLADNNPILCTIVIFIILIAFTKVRIKASDLFFLVGLSYLMFISRRQTSMFALLGTVVLSRLFVQLIEIYTKEKVEVFTKSIINKFTVFVIIAAVLIYSVENFNTHRRHRDINPSTYPIEAADWILENLDVNNIKLYNEYNYGSYLLFRGIPVFVDSRADLYTPEFNAPNGRISQGKTIFNDFLDSSNIGRYYGDVFEEYGITHLILYKSSKMNMLIEKADSEKYDLIYSDDNFVIYEILDK